MSNCYSSCSMVYVRAYLAHEEDGACFLTLTEYYLVLQWSKYKLDYTTTFSKTKLPQFLMPYVE